MYIIVDGPTLSLLLYSHLNSKGKQMGFLLGQKMEKVQSGITDSQIHTAQVHSYIYVTSFIPWPEHKCLYGRNGHIEEGVMRDILESSDQHVVGWYSFRHLTSQMASMKEVSIHNNLKHTKHADTTPEEFVFLLCTTSASRNLSTHSADHSFMVYRNERFVNIPMTVKNLGDTSRVDYIIENSSPATSKVVHANLGNFQKNFMTASGESKQVSQMKSLISSMSKGLESTQTKVNSSEAVLDLLEVEVSCLRDRVALLEREEMHRAFKRAELQKQKEEEDRRQQEKNREAEEEEQMTKLLVDLGLSEAVEKTTFPTYQLRSLSPAPTAISIPRLEAGVNPLYVSTLMEFDSPGLSLVDFNIEERSEEGSSSTRSNRPPRGKVQLLNAAGSNSDSDKDTGGEAPKAANHSFQPLAVQAKPKDPFDFVVHEVKSEMKVKQPSRVTRSAAVHKGEGNDKRRLQPSTGTDGSSSSNGHHTEDSDCLDDHDGPTPAKDSPRAATTGSDDAMTMSSSPIF